MAIESAWAALERADEVALDAFAPTARRQLSPDRRLELRSQWGARKGSDVVDHARAFPNAEVGFSSFVADSLTLASSTHFRATRYYAFEWAGVNYLRRLAAITPPRNEHMFDTRLLHRRRAIRDTLVVTDFCDRLCGLWWYSGPI
jgi:hypothetical protein